IENAGTVTLAGSGWFDPSNSGIVHNTGAFVHTGGSSFEISVAFTNEGTVTVDSGELHFSRPPVNNGTITVNSVLGFSNNPTNDGVISLGPNARMYSDNAYTETATATPRVHIAGTTATAGFGQLQVTRQVTLNGTLEVVNDNPFNPLNTDT